MTKKFTIEKVCPSLEEVAKPVLLKFQNGSLAAVTPETIQYSPAIHKRSRKRSSVVATSGHVYHGVNNAEDELTDSYLCVKNLSTNKVRIIPIEQVLLKNQIYTALEKESTLSQISTETSEQKLVKEFGGRKANRYVDNVKKMSMNMDIKDELDNTIKEANVNGDSAEENVAKPIYDSICPKFNKDAKDLHEVFNVADVVPQDLLDRLEEEAVTVQATKIENLPISSEYLKECILELQKSTTSAKGLMHIKLIIYMDGLMRTVKSRTRLFDKIELSGITEKVENDIRNRFCDPNCTKTRLRTKFSTEKALCHFIVLAALINDNYQVDLNVISKELCIPKTKIVKFANIVNIKKIKKSEILVLTLPSRMPPLPQKKTKVKK